MFPLICPARVALVVAAVLTTAVMAPAAAEGHAAFQDASPEPGARLPSAPGQITLAFTEPLNRQLTRARLVDARSGRPVAASVRVEAGNRLLLRPRRRLPTGAFRVEWHTAAILDGHALEGSVGFGVRARAVGGAQQLEQSPFARGGWLRVTLRAGWYAALFFFGGGLLCGMVLRSSAGPAGWLLAGEGASRFAPGGRPDAALRQIWGRTQAAGWFAVAAGIGVALVETQDAAGSLSWRSVDAYLLSTVSGCARAVAVAGVVLAAVLAGRASRVATLALLAALAALAVGGHANSASPRALALFTDWLHLVAAMAWAGGIAQIVATWLPAVGRLAEPQRRLVMRTVLPRFGRLALPAAVVVAVAGVGNALIELGRPAELWMTGYGRVLMVKIALVGAIAAASYLHAFRLRPQLVAMADGAPAAEGRHWRLLGSEPALAGLVLAAAALLAVFPLPPRQLLEGAEADSEAAVAPGMRPPQADQLAVAEAAGPWMAAAWVRPAGGSATGTLRLLDSSVRPVAAAILISHAAVARCGTGCVTFRTRGPAVSLKVTARLGNRVHQAVLPIRWDPGKTQAAERIVARAVAAIDRLRSQRIAERLSGGLGGPPAVSRYRIEGRHDYAIAARNAGPSETVVIGRRSWVRQPDGSWQKQRLDTLEDTRKLMPWWTHRTGVRLLDLRTAHRRRIADVALADIPQAGAQGLPFWFRLRVDLGSMRVLSMRMIAPAHFMNQRYYGLNSPVRIRPPLSGP